VPDTAQRAAELIRTLAGADAVLRDDQLRAIEAVAVEHRRVVVVQATGWGKSAVYWIATRMLRDAGAGPTLVVSPLLALMRDQVDAASRMGIVARTINSTNVDDWTAIQDEVAAGAVDVLLISPERLNNPSFRARVLPTLAATAGLLVIDEAHSISDWGHEFRPDYRRIGGVIEQLAPGVPVLATTATANARVTTDIAAQIGTDTVTIRGPLDRESLVLTVASLPGAAQRLAWLADTLGAETGSGIVYCLTVADAERVAGFLQAQGIGAAAYTGSTDPVERERVEADLKANRLRAVIATSALGMGYDKPDLAFVIHLGAPASPIAYYQQVGRAGRAIATARAVLVPTPEDRAVWAYFDSTAMPPPDVVARVLEAVGAGGPVNVAELEGVVNLRRGRLDALLKVLDVEGAVERSDGGWIRTTNPWVYDTDRLAAVAAARRAEQDAMLAYAATKGCRMRFLLDALDDPGATDCGRCDNCRGVAESTVAGPERAAAALAYLRGTDVIIEPRKQWPRGLPDRRGNIPVAARAEAGRALAFGTDPGWGDAIASAFAADGPISEEIVAGVVATLKRWDWAQRPTWVTWVPSRSRGRLVRSLAERIGEIGKLPVVDAVDRAAERPPQAFMANSARQCDNVTGAFRLRAAPVPDGPVLLVDDTVQSGWTMTVVAEALRAAGSGPVLPLALWRRP
jgi:ATP-dependent DNA helicase RecQ